MVSFAKSLSNPFFSSILLAILFASFANAMPWRRTVKHGTHRTRVVGKRGLQLETFHPRSNFKTYGAGLEHPALKKRAEMKEKCLSFIQSELNITDPATLGWRSGYSTDVAQFGYVRQYYDGVPIANAVANVAMIGDKVMSFANSFVDLSPSSSLLSSSTPKIANSTPTYNLAKAISNAETALSGAKNDVEPGVEYLVQPDGSLALSHVLQVSNKEDGTWYEAFVDAHSGELLSVTDFVAEATYKVLPMQKQYFTEGLETLVDPEDPQSSPLGWLSDGQDNFTATAGNNAIAFKGQPSVDTLTQASSAAGSVTFDFTYDDTISPIKGENIDASRTNAFYVVNTFHDVLYRYGFTEDAFNFQNDNLGKGGNGGEGDPVLISVQDASGTNNANFATPPDGQSGQMRMFIWTLTQVPRDGAVENDIVTHEMTHGLTNRMTGGGTGRCLQTTEAGGMGEGWSDAVAEWFEQSDGNGVVDYPMGQYVTNSEAGIRSAPYSTDPAVNSLTYGTIAQLNEVHDIGEVWANMLHNVHAALVDELGFSNTALTDATGTEGNVVFMQLLVDALAIQPCNPTIVEARDAILQADQNRFNGANQCTILNAFASRGLGLGADDTFTDDFTTSAECGGTVAGAGTGTGTGTGAGTATGAGAGQAGQTGAGQRGGQRQRQGAGRFGN
ncbi:hypothetical protein D9758_013266 [Tetrapyrgos nigripes]|uniref:Extracellular metalloproteinase n=1 Tax=Tetrapyrgos nigripes TaxID=182062 RepID=A0A8H5CM48_9AGAR|nr:hypothetical protein D9758_013266 [Tetrapyrgos nigripes]